MYWVCARCGETFYTSDTIRIGAPRPCDACGGCTGAQFDEDPELDSRMSALLDGSDRVIALSRPMEEASGLTELEAMGMPVAALLERLGPNTVFRELETLTGSSLVECYVGVPTA